MMEYAPEPPFAAGTPETAGKEAITSLMQADQSLIDAFWSQTRETAKKGNSA